MSAEQLSPGQNFTEPREGPTPIQSTSTAVGAFVGIAERGPVNKATIIGSMPEFNKIFGNPVSGSYLASAVRGFFENGGTACYVVRVAHYSDITDAATIDAVKATRQLTNGSSDALLVEASSHGAHGNALGISVVRQDTQVALTAEATGSSAITELDLTDIRRLYVGAQVKIAGAAASAGNVTGSAGPFNITPGQHWDVSIDGGGTLTFTFSGTRGAKTGTAAAYAGVAGTLVLRLNEDSSTDQTITFDGSENSQIEALNRINTSWIGGAALDASGEVKLQSDRYGTSSQVRIVSGTGALLTDLGLATGTGTAGTATCDGGGGASTYTIAFLDAATAAEVATAITGETLTGATITAVSGALRVLSGTTGGSSSVEIKSSSTELLGFTASVVNSGSATATIRFIVTRIDAGQKRVYFASLTPSASIAGSTAVYLEEVDLLFYRSGSFLERVAGLAMNATAGAKYINSVVNNGDPVRQVYINTNNGISASSTADPRPANGTSLALGTTTAGSDGTTPNDTDHIGDATTSATEGGRGLYALDTIDDWNLLAVPGRTAAAVHAAMITYAENRPTADVFAILDPPAANTPSALKTYVTVTANLFSEFAAIYYPWVQKVDPDTGVLTSYPPSGDVMGVYARTDAARGVQKAPAGTPDGKLANVLGLERSLSKADKDMLYPVNINFIMPIKGRGICVYGSRTLSSGQFRQINVRRVFNFVKRSLKDGLQWVTFEPSNADTRARVRKDAEAFLLRQWRRKVLTGEAASDAFFVICDDTNNPPSVENAGQLICKIGLAVAKPAEFIEFQLVQDTRALDAELANANG